MSSPKNAIKSLLQKYIAGEPFTESEQSEFDDWKAGLKYYPDLADLLRDPNWVAKELTERSQFPEEEVWAMVLGRIAEEEKEEETEGKKKTIIVEEERPIEQQETAIVEEQQPMWQVQKSMGTRFPSRMKYVAAACILVVGVGIYLLTQRAARPVSAPVTGVAEKGSAKEIQKAIVSNKISDKGQDHTVLTLSDQRRIVIDAAATDEPLTTVNHATVSLGAGNRLTYQSSERPQPGEEIAYNVFETGKNISFPYEIKLSEGSTITVNAGSKIRYPVAFSEKAARKVELWGEAYFEVSPQAGAPFEVTVNGATIEVLGTAFNVKTFAHSEGRITLIEGRVKVESQKNPAKSFLLKPLEQVRISKDADLQWQKITDTNSIVEWKQRQFHFDGKSFNQILREVAEWYRLKLPDITMIKGELIGGIYSRDLPAATILRTIQTLENDKIRFSLKGDSLQIRQKP
jgi:hypothetical protein